jgi:hypothetical protein
MMVALARSGGGNGTVDDLYEDGVGGISGLFVLSFADWFTAHDWLIVGSWEHGLDDQRSWYH